MRTPAGCSSGKTSATATASVGSSISEHLTKTLSGWHVDGFLSDDAATSVAVVVSILSHLSRESWLEPVVCKKLLEQE